MSNAKHLLSLSLVITYPHHTMEILLHYVWKHKLLPLGPLHTTDGREVEVIDAGLHNHDAGPDFFNAKLKIDGTLWVGNVEIHTRSREWYAHGHNSDTSYDNVILHVAEVVDATVVNSKGAEIPQVELKVPDDVANNYQELLATDTYPPCYKIVPKLTSLTVHSWMAALQTERLEQKRLAIEERVNRCEGSWEDAYFATIARNYGFGINGEAFETWAMEVPLKSVAHHRDDLFQVEAFFMGQAGLLEIDAIPKQYRQDAINDGYFTKLRGEYMFLANKFGLKPINYKMWKFMRLRPQNFPHIRISQLATLYHEGRTRLRALLECRTAEEIRRLLKTHVTPYWESHYTFGSKSAKVAKSLSTASLNLLIINTAIPMLFAYSTHIADQGTRDRAFDLYDQIKAENNNIIRMWQECGLRVENAGDTQALIQLKKQYCDRRECLRCRIGYEYLKGKRG